VVIPAGATGFHPHLCEPGGPSGRGILPSEETPASQRPALTASELALIASEVAKRVPATGGLRPCPTGGRSDLPGFPKSSGDAPEALAEPPGSPGDFAGRPTDAPVASVAATWMAWTCPRPFRIIT